LPYVVQLRWGWHRVERTLERGKFSLDGLFDRAFSWCLECLPLTPVRLGNEQRTVHAIDSSTIVRLRATKKRCALLGKGYCHRVQRAVKANIVAALTTVVMVRGVRVGVRRTRFGATCRALPTLCRLAPSPDKRLFSVDAGICDHGEFAAATVDALVGACARMWPCVVPRVPAAVASADEPQCMARCCILGHATEGGTDEDTTLSLEDRQVRVRRWNNLHFTQAPRR
jgi:hypothetical protein